MPFQRRLAVRLLAPIAVLLFMAGCATLPGSAPSPAEQASADHAAALYAQGNFDAAAAAWLELAQHTRSGREALQLKAAEAYRQENAWAKVAPVLDTIHTRHLTPDETEHLTVLRAEAAQAGGDTASALNLTDAATSMSATWQPRALEARARAQVASGLPLDAVRTRLALDKLLHGYDRSQNQDQIRATLAKLDNAQLSAVGKGLAAGDPLQPWLAQALKKKGSALAMTLPQLDRPVGTVLPDNAREGYHPPQHVALILPLAGTLAPAAAAVRDGFLAAQKADPQGSQMQVEGIDAGDSVATTLAAYQQAVSSGADMVVGPLSPDAVGALFQRGKLAVPMLALNHPDSGLPPPGSAEFALPPEAEAAQVAAHMHTLGLTSAVMFVAQDNWAGRASRAFRAQFESLGGQVFGTATLDPTQVNYADVIQTLLGHADSRTGIFLALGPTQGRLLVPQLRIAQVAQPLFATSHIYAADTNAGLDRDLDGVEFCDAPWLFDAQPGLPRRADLEVTTPTTVGPAARLFAFGMDAYALLPYLGWLREHRTSYLAGATGLLTMDSFGRVQRTPIWVQFVNGVATIASGSLDVAKPDTN